MNKIQIRSRHDSHDPLRYNNVLPLLPFKSVVRFGSLTEYKDTIEKGGYRIELNTTDSIKNSSNKLLMKQCFTNNQVKTADWFIFNTEEGIFNLPDKDGIEINSLPFPIISKHIFGSRGSGNKKHDNLESLQQWMINKNLDNYIFEKFYNYNREYRLHVNKFGCFYSCRKLLKQDTPDDKRWFRNDSNCVWILEDNIAFDKPLNWNYIVEESIKALNAVGLDFGAVDVKIQSSKNKKGKIIDNPDFIIIEINSAPSFGEITLKKYIEVIPFLLKNKFLQLNTN